jgi:hypothetical protein
MKKQLQHIFGAMICEECLESVNMQSFEILDPAADDSSQQEKCRIVESDGHFQVENKDAQWIHFLPIDGCLPIPADHKKCDFALFDDKQFCFADIKNVKTKLRQQAKKSAKLQLEETIRYFKKDLKINFDNHKLLAIIALTFQKTYPLAKVEDQDAKIRFEDQFQAELCVGNQISF